MVCRFHVKSTYAKQQLDFTNLQSQSTIPPRGQTNRNDVRLGEGRKRYMPTMRVPQKEYIRCLNGSHYQCASHLG